MKPGVAFLCASLTLLGASAPAFADDAGAGSNLQVGGLKPPDAVQTDPGPSAPSSTEAQLDRADKEDSGRGLEFVALHADVGPQVLGLHTLKANRLVDGQYLDSKGTGLAVGAGLGVRLLAFTVGARFGYSKFSDWALWTLGAEAGLHLPLGRLEPYFTLGAGYASLGSFSKSSSGFSPNSAHGVDVRGGAGLDYYLSNTFSVGANLSGDVLFLSRKGGGPQSLTTDPNADPASLSYAADGSGIGVGGTLSAVLGLHF